MVLIGIGSYSACGAQYKQLMLVTGWHSATIIIANIVYLETTLSKGKKTSQNRKLFY